MPYNIIPAGIAGGVLTASYINTNYKSNIEWLLNQKQIIQQRYTKTGNYLLTGTTTFGDIDATNLKVTLNSSFITGRIEFFASFWASVGSTDAGAAPAYEGYFDAILDSTTYLSSGTGTPGATGVDMTGFGTGAKIQQTTTVIPAKIIVAGVFTNVLAGTHDIKLRWKVNKATATLSVLCDTNPFVYMRATEL